MFDERVEDVMMGELRDCIWCRATQDDLEVGHGAVDGYTVDCNECGWSGPVADTPDAAVDEWNEFMDMGRL